MADDDVRATRTTKAAAAPAKSAAVKKAASARKAAVKKAAAKAPVKKASAQKASVKKAPVKKAPVKKAPVKKAAKRAAKAPAKRQATPDAGPLLAGDEKRPPPLRLAAEQTFADEPRQPAPEPTGEDSSARMRGILRAAAASLEGREKPSPAAAVEEEGEWSPPEVLEETPPPPPPPAAAPPPASPPPPPPPSARAPTEAVAVRQPPTPPPGVERKGRGAGLSVLAIVLAIVVPIVGAVVGFLLANRGRQRGAPLAGVARVVSVVALAAWLVGGVLALASSDEGVDYSKLEVGDCFDSAATNEVRGVKVKSCLEPHNSEIFFIVTHPAGPDEPYPGKDALVQFAADACLGQPLTDYLGIPLEQSKLKDFEIVPQESAWKDGRRALVCGLDTGGEGRITGSVRGTRR